MRVYSGIQPSGGLHLGNYFGAIKQQIELQTQHECTYFIADYHALTTQRDAAALRASSIEIAADYIALGIDPKKTVMYRQSDVPVVTELSWILSCVTSFGLMKRAPAFKEKVAAGLDANMGLFSYPILMAADILGNSADLVPVGKDQLPHIEIAQDIQQAFNAAFKCDILRRPEAIMSQTPRVVGTDGNKMSKSYGNTIELLADEKTVIKQIKRIVTDSRREGESADWCHDNASAILDLFLSDDERLTYATRLNDGMGYGTIKDAIIEKHRELFGAARERKHELLHDRTYLEGVLEAGAETIRNRMHHVMSDVKEAIGLR